MTSVKTQIREFIKDYNTAIVGFGKIPETVELLEINEKLARVVVIGYPLSKSVLKTIKDRPTLIYKHHYKTINWILDQTAYHCAKYIEDMDKKAIPIPASQLVNWETHKGHISHRALAQEAGLGYIGRSGLLIHPEFGAQVRYVSILTDLDFEPDKKINDDCGTCQKCIAACPAQAITAKGVDIKSCYEKLCEFSRIRGIGQHICGVCVKVCDGRN